VFRAYNRSSLLPREPQKATWSGMVRDFQRLLTAIRPNIIVTAHPMLDDHPDHQYASLALLQALAQASLGDGRLYLYTNHCVHTGLYPFGMPDGAISLPPAFGEPSQHWGLFSYPLSPQQQMDKLFALEAMHALRDAPPIARAQRGRAKEGVDATKDLIRGTDEFVYSYFRRAFRPNELFFVEPFDAAERLAAEFLGHQPKP